MTTTHVETPAVIVADYFGQAIDELEGWKARFATELAAARARGPVTTDVLDALVAPYALRTFDALALPVYGSGFIAALDSLSDARSHLAWWQGADRGKLVLAAQSVNKEAIDYSELEWYRVPHQTGEAHVAGPYVDYLCSDEYTITIASPVFLDDEFVGVAGLDLLIDQVERDLTPKLAPHGADISIVNGVGRVLLSTSPHRETGDTVRGAELDALTRTECPGMALAVLAG
ncbi:cache domain-containing protein [Microcella putealis]|uniref:Cache domain-containing protein n=1 Tax=Microcella putealis TaxID=337005 RepID=A0A4Q7LZN9_9MICO|nr:cache domain-containing protein [Microcella putealis]RZS59752.1 cache domain-containing protein [Microcella putealis]TQM26865.1 cache domain-containing protein [Microcella putealis]